MNMNLDVAKQSAQIVFSDTYLGARQKFLEAAPTSRAYKYGVKGPSGEELSTDVTYFGDPRAKKLLIIVSATHGVEGYCGSAAQLLFLQAGFHKMLPPSTSVLIVHALNSYGFAWDRRVTVEGVDLNRNFVDFSKPLPKNPGYEELDDYIVPADISEESIRRAEAAIAAYQAKHGEQSFRIAYSGGQYTRPGGAFYGGTEPTETRRTLEKIVSDYDVSSRGHVMIIDYHTGLGPHGYGELQCELSSGREGYERAANVFGASVTSPVLGTSSAVCIPGTQDEYWERTLGDRHTYVGPEFGTYPSPGGRNVLRKDHWLFKHRPDAADSDLGRQIRRATKAHFYPDTPEWKEMVVWRSHQVNRQAFEWLVNG
ncbi:DUF2817 domain-containing protein [Paraburkholderia phenoliruptrix]|uniref:DUF2817 domain-containing protein n=1 Tax=Paraburkholderia phenoliruptrix TaxID=252970 RepID=UPI002869D101|nr:DUF2817 domain-containing protein [Paraburkholderia phenoliruptrix]WMY11027.1 DUF2817 domain-containing protein [Paraburkholderia phenoliruptrix]